MSTLRPMGPKDLLKFNQCNLDNLTETYSISFYLEYFMKWPQLCLVMEDSQGQVEAYILGKYESSPYRPPQPYDPALPFYRSPTSPGQNYLAPHVHVTCLTVSPRVRRQGHAATLTAALERYGDEHGAWFVDLFVRKSNTPAVNLYRKMGYTVWRTVRSYYGDGEAAWDMRKPLKRDVKRMTIREGGEEAYVDPEDVW